jgi:hypothetical protein
MVIQRPLEARLFQIKSLFVIATCGTFVLGAGCSNGSSSKPSGNHETTYSYNLSDASVPENVTETAACAHYVIASCVRRNECLGTVDDCFAQVAYCPDAVFSLGSTRNPQTTWACAEALRVRSCEDLVVSRNPDCVTKGTRKTGESCIVAAQCESLTCSGSPVSCGTCIERQDINEPCAADAPCSAGLLCDSASGKCIAPDPTTLKAFLTNAPLKLGAPCDGGSKCEDTAYCAIDDGQTSGVCSPRKALTENCHASRECAKGSYCAIESIRCAPTPSEGGHCGTDFELNASVWCDDSTYCNDETVTCTKLPEAEAPCATNLQLNNVPALCAKGTYCDSSLTPPTCKALAGAGTPCLDNTTCAPELSCLCDDATCNSRSCAKFREFGESCTDPGDRCLVQVGSCLDGLCQPSSTQELFTYACGS